MPPLARWRGAGSCSSAESAWGLWRCETCCRPRIRWAPKLPHHTPTAKNVIFLFMGGGPSHLELFDNKPELAKHEGTLPPEGLLEGYRAAFIDPNSTLLGPKFKFARHGESGAELSELIPHTAAIADDIAIVKSLVTDAFNHAPAQVMMSTGTQQFGRPSMGAWDAVRAGQRVPRPAGIRGLQFGPEGPQRRKLQLGQRLSAFHVPRRAVPHQRRSGAVSVQPGRGRPPAPARLAGRAGAPERHAPARSGRPRDRDPDQFLRDGLPHAGKHARADGHFPRAAARARHVRGRAGTSIVSPTTASWRAGWSNAACASWNCFHESWDQHGSLISGLKRELPGHRQGQCRLGQRSQAARPPGRHARAVGRRVRAHADGAGRH